MEIWTIQKLLNWMTGYFAQKQLDSPRLSAELLLCHVLGLKRIELYTLYDRVVQQPQLGQLRELVKRAAEHEPIAYLVGRCEFYSLSLKITPACLIPRPETELLVEKAVEFLRKRPAPRQALDLCTGSGCIAVALVKNCKDLQVTAVDLSEAALSVAAENVRAHNLEASVRLLCGNLYEPLIEELDNPRFDLIVSNPPYVSDAEYETLPPTVKNYEPKQALCGGADGLEIHRRIIGQAERFLRPDGALMLEIGFEQGPAVKNLLEQSGLFASVDIFKDLAQKDRIAVGKR
jgi:release factor glutamine methyltransferase